MRFRVHDGGSTEAYFGALRRGRKITVHVGQRASASVLALVVGRQTCLPDTAPIRMETSSRGGSAMPSGVSEPSSVATGWQLRLHAGGGIESDPPCNFGCVGNGWWTLGLRALLRRPEPLFGDGSRSTFGSATPLLRFGTASAPVTSVTRVTRQNVHVRTKPMGASGARTWKHGRRATDCLVEQNPEVE